MNKYRRKTGENKFADIGPQDTVHIGLDVHKESVHSAIRVNGRTITAVMPARVDSIIATLEPLRPACRTIVYEAGPTGYGLARALQDRQWPIEVIAPGKTPKLANEGNKADRLDCCKLAEYSEKNILKKVVIPTEQEEADRHVVRLRDQLVKKQRRAKQQIKSFLLMQGIKAPPGLQYWTQRSIADLRHLDLLRELRFTLDVLLDELEYLGQQLHRVVEEIQGLAQEKRYACKQARLRTHPGVGPTVAMKYLTEVYQPNRFSDPGQVACYLGLAPSVRESGEKRREGPLLKAGQGSLRAMLVQGAWSWVRLDRHAAKTYRRLVRNTGCPQMAIVGMARRMAINLWCMVVREHDYQPLGA